MSTGAPGKQCGQFLQVTATITTTRHLSVERSKQSGGFRLRVEGANIGGGAIVFENETRLEFSRQFLSISISTNKAIYDGGHKMRYS